MILSNLHKKILMLFTSVALSYGILQAEGIKELANGTTNYPETQFGTNGWADPGAPDNLKMFIYIEDPTTESMYFGFSATGEAYNVYDPNDSLVYSNTSNGNASVVAEAIAGPNEVIGTGGYTAQVFTLPPGSPAGNYYIEFDGSADIAYWDISVAKSGNTYTEIGRVWSMIWYFNMGGWGSANSFESTLYAYSTEGFVSKVNYNNSNFRPYVFTIYYNATGPGSTGDMEEDRKSVNGSEAGTASFPVFLNPPPEEIMPSASFGDLVGDPFITRTASTGSNKFQFNLSSTQPGTFRILLNVENPSTPDYYDDVTNTKDRVLIYDIVPAPGESPPYVRALPWDGLDGDGNELADGFPLNFTVAYADGRSHFPTFDAEYLADGISVDQVRPSNAYDIQLFWDDSNIPDDPNTSTHSDFPDGTTGYNLELNGANPPAHTWVNSNYGNNNTINTWWYCSLKQDEDTTINLPGVAGVAPTVQATDVTFSEIGNTAMKISWTNGNGVMRAVFMKATGSGQPTPVDNTTYTANSVFGLGDELGTGWYCVYNDAASPQVVVTGLTEDTEYRVMVFEYNNGNGIEYYNTNTATGNPANDTTIIIDQATNVNFTNVLSNSFTVNWTNGTGTRRAAFIKLSSVAGDAIPVNTVTYESSSVYGVGDPIEGTQWYCIYNGTDSTVDVTNLAKNTNYTVMVCEYFGSDGNENYVTVTNATDPNNQTTLSESPSYHIVFSNVSTNSMQIDWTNGDGIARQVFVKQTSSTSDEPAPVDGTSYTANTVFGSGEQIGTTGWYCVYDGTPSTVTITGLSPSTDYRVKVCDYTGSYNYIVGSVSTNPRTQATYGTTPTIQAYNLTFPNTGASQMEINWEKGNGTKRIVFASQTTTGQPMPVDGTNYNDNQGFGLGSEIGSSGWFCVYNGTDTMVTINNILEATTYRFMVCEYNQDVTGPLYNTSTAVNNPMNNTSLTAGITVGTISQNTNEDGQTATFSIVLNTQPTANVTIGLSSDDIGEGTLAVSDVTFTPSNWSDPQIITVTGQNDAIFDGSIAYNIITAAASSGDSDYNGIDPDNVAVVNEDNETPDANLSVTVNGNENGPIDIEYTVTLSVTNNTGSAINFDFDDLGTGTATSGSDYTAVAGAATISVADGASTGTINVIVTDDALLEGTETIIAQISNASNPSVNINTASATANISDDETANADLSVTANGDENGPVNIEYTVTLSATNNTGADITFDIDDLGTGTATSGSDYTAIPGAATINVADGASTGTIAVAVTNDALLEATETLIAQISNPSLAGISITTASASANISDDETANADLSVTANGDENGPVNIEYTVTLSATNNTGADITFDFDDLGTGTATSGTDYTAIPGAATINIADGATTGTISVAVSNDALLEATETFIAQISNPSLAGISITTASASANISDDETADADLSVTANGDENGPVDIEYTVTLSATNNTGSAITFDFDDLGTGTATSGSDYTAVAGAATISVADGASTGTINVAVTDDALLEGTETIIAQISNASNPNVNITTASATANLSDDETANADLSVTANGDENGPANIEYTVTLSATNNTGADITFDFDDLGTGTATSGSDYTAIPGAATINIADGASTGTISVAVSNDALLEATETFIAQISNPSLAGISITTASASANISDDETADADLSVSANGDENGPVDIEYTVTLSATNNTGSAITFDFDDLGTGTATSGSDYTAVAGAATISVAHGASTGTINVAVTDDALLEGTETIIAQISNASNPNVNINTTSATANISDDETANADLSVTANGDENGPANIEYTVTLSVTNNTGTDITLDFDDLGTGTATSGSDYTAIPGAATISIADGATTGTISVAVSNDALLEATETFIAQISNPSLAGISITTASASANISDDETADADLSVTANGDENGPVDVEYTVTLSATNNTGSAITFDFDDLGTGTATSGSDYTAVAGSATISVADGASSGTVNIAVTDDALLEGTETIIAQISNSSNLSININTATASANLVDDEVTNADLSVTVVGDENGPVAIEYTVTLSETNNTGSTITFDFDDLGTGTATSGSDYTAIPGAATISIADGATTGSITVSVNDDALLEGTETIIAQISNSSNPSININTATATADITDDETANADLSVSVNGDENGPVNIEYTVTLSETNNTGAAITFDFIDLGTGSATAGSDYTALSGGETISIADGATTGTITVAVTDDALMEGNETVITQINNPSLASVTITTASATANLIDDEATSANLSVTVSGDENGPANIEFTVTLSETNNTGSAITFDFDDLGTGTATSGSDYTAIAGGAIISIADGATTGTISVTVTDDALLEGTETLIAQISNSSNPSVSIATATATADIMDNETANADLSVTANGDESGPVNIEYTVTLSETNNTGAAITFDFDDLGTGTAASGSDYTAVAGAEVISIANGTTTGTVTVSVIDDAIFENTETFIAQISNSSLASITINTASATADIADNDSEPLVTLSGDPMTIDEDGGASTLTATLSNESIYDVTVTLTYSGTATDGTDYTGSTTITVTAGSLTGTATISSVNDNEYEGSETIIAEIENITNGTEDGTQQVTISINDDENPDNNTPSIVDDNITVAEDGVATGNLLANDSDSDGDSLIINTTPVTPPSNGSLVINSDGTFEYTPDPDFNGTDSFEYEVCDDGNPVACATATVSITITAVDDDADGDGIPDDIEGNDDPDNDSIPSYLDLDSDGDGIPDADEGNIDSDGDGNSDYKDLDSDDDGIPDSEEGNVDTDGDGDYDYRDLDSDNDGIPDSEESNGDCDRDGISDRIDPDDCKNVEIFVPEGFSPNGDGDNDFFEIPQLEYFNHVSIKIFNRWGNVIYKMENYENDWDGSSNTNMSLGEELPAGTYFYQIIVHDTDEILTGYVYLNR